MHKVTAPMRAMIVESIQRGIRSLAIQARQLELDRYRLARVAKGLDAPQEIRPTIAQ